MPFASRCSGRFPFAATAALALLGGWVFAAGSERDRTAPTIESVRLAIEDLTRSFGGNYPKGAQYLARLESLAEAAASGDFDRELGALQTEALLANPLLDFGWEPGPVADSRYTAEQMERMEYGHIRFQRRVLPGIVARIAPGWTVSHCGMREVHRHYRHYRGDEPPLITHPPDRQVTAARNTTRARRRESPPRPAARKDRSHA